MIKLFFRPPWFVFLFFAIVSLVVGAYSFQHAKTMNSHRAAALAGDIPKLVDASAANEASFTAAEEINVSSQVSDQIYTVSVSGRRTVDKSKTTIFALPTDSATDTATVNVVYMFEPRRGVDKFFEQFATGNFGEVSAILNVNGKEYAPGRKLSKSVRNAAEQAGLKLSKDVIFVEPFFDGRKRGLAMDLPIANFLIFAGFAVILAIISLIKFLLSARRKKKLAAANLTQPIQA